MVSQRCATCHMERACGRPCPFIPRQRRAGELLYLEGERARTVGYVKRGSVVLLRDNTRAGRDPRPHAVRGEGSFLGLEALVRDAYLDTARALTDVEVCWQPSEAFRGWLGEPQSPARVALEQTLRATIGDAPRGASPDGTASRRVARWLLDEARRGAAPSLPRQVVADMLGMVPATFSRALTRLARAGAIRATRRTLSVCDPMALERAAE